MTRILVLRGGALGDFIVTLPALQLLRQRWPDAQIELVGNPRAAELARLSGLLVAVHSQQEGRWSQLYADKPLSIELRAWLDSFDLIISYWPDPDGDLARHFADRGAAFIQSSAHVSSMPAAAHFCAALAPLGLSTTDFTPHLRLPAEHDAEAERRLRGLQHFAAIHPGSGSPRKNWPRDRWSALVARLRRPLLVVTGEAESDVPFWPAYMTVRHAHEWPLPVLAAALARANLFIGHDSGVSHLAAAVGVPCVLLFGPTEPAIWAPPGAAVVRRGEDLSAISVDNVFAATQDVLSPQQFNR